MSPIETGPFYGIELSPSMLNTQGGPRRNERGQIVRPDNSPIPRLYSSGELGSIYSYLYQGTGNIGECWHSVESPGATPRRSHLGTRLTIRLDGLRWGVFLPPTGYVESVVRAISQIL